MNGIHAIAGATVAETPEEAAAHSDVVISIVTNDAALEEVMLGPNGVLAGTHAGSVIIDMHKDFLLVLSQANDLSVSMPATAAAQQMSSAAMAKGKDADFSLMIQFMEELAGLSTISEERRRK